MLPHQPRKAYSFSGYRLLYYTQVTSTNDVAKEVGKSSQETNVVIVAATQTHGRGRQGKQWVSPMGGLWLSILLRRETSLKETAKLTIVTASAVAEAIKNVSGLETEVKWPNDVLVRGKKLGGILVETCSKGDNVDCAIIGIGVNTNIDLLAFPHDLRKSATTLEHELDCKVDNEQLLAHLLRGFDLRHTWLQQGDWGNLRREWERRAKFLGRRVEVASFGELLVGEALGLDSSGALMIGLNGGLTKRILAGDVKVK
jgi:BirA family biotin operon repressor/biotin-[acetyl-CoA-carboxylase] ligase